MMMMAATVSAIADLFKYKIATTIIVLACWPATDRIKLAQQFIKHGLSTTFSCDMTALESVHPYRLQGVLSFQSSNISIKKVKTEYFSHWYKWVIVGNMTPNLFEELRYDADVVLIETQPWKETPETSLSYDVSKIFIKDVYIHPSEGASLSPWAVWSAANGLQLTHDRERTLRRLNLNQYPLTIAAPMGYYTKDTYNGSFEDYVKDISTPERDPGIRCGYGTSALVVEALNATEVLIGTQLWSTEVNNSSMILMVSGGAAQLAGGVLRILHERITRLDYVLPIWPFSLGFTYLAERESSNNMFLEPFTTGVWWSSLGLVVILALVQRLMARRPEEKEGAYVTVLASYLQQDASAVPEGISGRLTFMVLSISSMLIHAYYTSAIVSALMSTGRSGPDTLTSLADSKYAIHSEDYDYMRYLMFDVETNRHDLEYLKRKKKTLKFYQNIEHGVRLIQEGNHAYHTEYNQLYPRLKSFSDEQICKLQYVDTVAETMSWVTTTKRGQWIDVFRSKGQWLHETGLAKRLLSRLKLKPPPCRSALLAERVKLGDVVPVILLSIFGALVSLIQLGIEILFSRWRTTKKSSSTRTDTVQSKEVYFEEVHPFYQ